MFDASTMRSCTFPQSTRSRRDGRDREIDVASGYSGTPLPQKLEITDARAQDSMTWIAGAKKRRT